MADPMLLLDLDVGQPVEAGSINGIRRRCIPILGGSVLGCSDGIVLPGGSDWQAVLPDGSLEIEARYILDLSDGRVEVDSRGIRHASPEVLERLAAGDPVDSALYYFRTAMRFRTESPRLAWLNTIMAIARGERLAGKVRLSVLAVD